MDCVTLLNWSFPHFDPLFWTQNVARSHNELRRCKFGGDGGVWLGPKTFMRRWLWKGVKSEI